MRGSVLAGVAIGALIAGSPAMAGQSAPGDKAARTPTQGSRTEVYDAAFFAQYAPRTAYDIVQRIPGFTLDLGNSAASTGVDVRGFAAGAVTLALGPPGALAGGGVVVSVVCGCWCGCGCGFGGKKYWKPKKISTVRTMAMRRLRCWSMRESSFGAA